MIVLSVFVLPHMVDIDHPSNLSLHHILLFYRIYYYRINTQDKRGEWDSNPRVLANMGLAIPRPTRLGDPRFTIIFLLGYINYLQ